MNDSWPLEFKPGLFDLLRKANRLIVAYSGGLDSTVLLHLLAKNKLSKNTLVVHINHGLSENANQWAHLCKNYCNELAFSFQLIKVNAKVQKGESPENAARLARYKAFEDLMLPYDYLLTAHHQDDQIETFFLQLFRGAGVKGLSAMPEIKAFGRGYLLRPLLNYTRLQIYNYAKAYELKWVDDESNFDTNYQRNFLRHDILPIIQRRWPAMPTAVLRSIEHCQLADTLLNDLADIDLKKLQNNKQLLIDQLLQLTEARRNNCLRYWIKQQGFTLPSAIKLAQITHNTLLASQDANPLIAWEGAQVRRYRNELFIMKPLKGFDTQQIIPWDINKPLILPADFGSVDVNLYETLNLQKPKKGTQVSIRFRQGGEKLKISGRVGHHDLKKLFQERGIPPWERYRTPLLYHDEELVGILQKMPS